MPGILGFELLSAVRHCFPSVRVITMSDSSSCDEAPLGLADALYRKGSDICSLLKSFEGLPRLKWLPAACTSRLLHVGFSATQATPLENLTLRSIARNAYGLLS